ncbi:MAG: 2-C-methyl-D-erythritol 4-phosphate cytidylyltransferase [Gammaproteobacteria bacterium]|nr:2-C-methyl-D-erythritol 4-phosphate cytidylyltransferase [Gammaproteobacteria bacterium]
MPAAGRGQRLGADLPKQYLSIAGRTLLEWALRPFVADPACRGLVVALGPGDPYWPAVRARLGRAVIEAPGGKERGDSVRQALETLRTRGAADTDWVLVHDAARPCVTAAEIAALRHGVVRESTAPDGLAANAPLAGGLLALPLADTLKRSAVAGAGVVSAATVPREGLWRALTPQMFRLGELLDALRAAAAAGRVPTDEAQAMEWRGATPRLISGESTNLKVTTMADLALAEGILRGREASAAVMEGAKT